MVPAPSQDTFRAAVSAFFNQNNSTVWSQPALSGLRLNTPEPAPILLDLNGEELSLSPRIGLISDCKTRSFRIGENIIVFEKGEAFAFTPTRGSAGAPEQEVEDGAIRSPMPGRIVDLPVIHGELVVQGQPLVTLEAMKMEHVMKAPFDAIVAKIHASLGDHVTESTLLLSLEKQDQ